MADCKCDKIVGKWISLCCGSGCYGDNGGGDGTFQVNCKKVTVESSGDFEAELVQGETFADYLKVKSDGSPITFNVSLENNNPPSLADFVAFNNGDPIPWYDSKAEDISSLVFHLGETFAQWGKYVGSTQTLVVGDTELEFTWVDLGQEVEVRIKVTGDYIEHYDAWIHKEFGKDVKLVVTTSTLWQFALVGEHGETVSDPLTRDSSEVPMGEIQIVVDGYAEFRFVDIPLGSTAVVTYETGGFQTEASYHSSSKGQHDSINMDILSNFYSSRTSNIFSCSEALSAGQQV